MSDRLEIIIARHAGFCMGVRRALNLCLDAANSPTSPKPVSTLGPLIHNRQVLQTLEQKEVRAIGEGVSPGEVGTAVIRAHGISPAKLNETRRFSKKIIDATCPHVRKVQEIVRKYSARGYKCIIVGDPGHAEVEGVMSYAGEAGVVVNTPRDVANLGHMGKAVVVAQTTQNKTVFQDLSSQIRAKCGECKIFDTICKATQERQEEAVQLAREVDAVIVVGGYNSANTCRLAQICADTGTPVFHVENEDELPVEKIFEFHRIGITAGGSTPNWMIKRVTGRLRNSEEERNRPLACRFRRILTVPIRTNAFLGGGAACMTYAAFALLELPSGPLALCMALAFCFIVSQHLLHQYTKLKAMQLNEPELGKFFETHARLLLLLASATAALSIGLSFRLGTAPFVLILLGTAGGLLYCMPKRTKPIFAGLDRGRQLTGSKEFFVALAWATTTVLVPFLSVDLPEKRIAPLAVFALFAALLAFYRTLLTDMRDVEGDQLVGRETIVVAFGLRVSARILLLIAPIQFFLLLGSALIGWISGVGYVMLLVPCYYMLINRLYLHNQLPG